MPATDWREVTYSRSRLRPFDGLDPTVKRLKQQCKGLSVKKTVEAYGRAKNLLEEVDTRKRANAFNIKREEIVRQENERHQLSEAFKLRVDAFNAEWEHRRQETETKCAQKIQDFDDKAEAQRANLEMQIAKTPTPPVKYSTLVRDDRIIEDKNAQAGSFELAMRYNKSLAGQMKLEEETHTKRWQLKVEKQRKDLEMRLEKERQNLMDGCDRMRYAFDFQLKVAMERLQQSHKNLSLDQSHALALEFIQKKEVRKTLTTRIEKTKSYASRPKSSSTFIGRNMMESFGRGSRDVPSVCKMEFDIPNTPRFPLSDRGGVGPRPRTTSR